MEALVESKWRAGSTGYEVMVALCEAFPADAANLTTTAVYAKINGMGLRGQGGTGRHGHAKGSPKQFRKTAHELLGLEAERPVFAKPAFTAERTAGHDLSELLSPDIRERAAIVMEWKLAGNEGLMTADMITAVQMERRQKRAA